MGNFLGIFAGGPEAILILKEGGDTSRMISDVKIKGTYENAKSVEEEAKKAVKYLKEYVGNDALVQKAMKSPKDEAVRREAFEGMFPNIEAIRSFYELSQSYGDVVGALILAISAGKNSQSGLGEPEIALASRLALLFRYVFVFDWAKMTKPAVQNDFSFYRRELSKNRNNPKAPVDDGEASAISMFVAQASPLLTALGNTMVQLSREKKVVGPFLAEFVHLCQANGQFYKKGAEKDPSATETSFYAMVVGIALYDRIDPSGAFAKGSSIDIKKCVQSLNSWDHENKDSCLSTLQYSTKTFNSAPSNIRKLFP